MATPLVPITVAWLIGIWLASRIALPSPALGVAIIVAVVGIVLTWRRSPKPRWVLVLTLAATLGALRYNLAQPRFDQTSLATYNDQQQPIIVEGVVIAWTERLWQIPTSSQTKFCMREMRSVGRRSRTKPPNTPARSPFVITYVTGVWR